MSLLLFFQDVASVLFEDVLCSGVIDAKLLSCLLNCALPVGEELNQLLSLLRRYEVIVTFVTREFFREVFLSLTITLLT